MILCGFYFKKIIFMKKNFIFLIVCLLFLLAGCGKTEQDPYKGFRDYSSNKIFHDGEKALAKGDYARAVKYFEALDALYPFGPNAEQGQLDIIYSYYMNEDSTSASIAADRFIRLYPRSKNVDYAYYMRGVVSLNSGLSWLQKKFNIDQSLRDAGSLQQAFTSLSLLTQIYPESIYVSDAVRKMRYIRNLLAKRELSIARFYMKRKAYVAAANRASYIVEHFQGALAVPHALKLMVICYRRLGLSVMASDSYNLLKQNFPTSKEFRSLRRI